MFSPRLYWHPEIQKPGNTLHIGTEDMTEDPASTVNDVNGSTPANDTTPATTTGMLYGLPVVERSEVWRPDVVQRVATLLPLIAATLLGNGHVAWQRRHHRRAHVQSL